MKAVILAKIGGVEKLIYQPIATPVVKPEEMLVKVLYCGINHLDILVRQGKRPGIPQFPHILGSEIIGQLPSGEIVAVYPWIFCGECKQCISGNEQICDNGGTFGRTVCGGYAEYVVVPKKNIVRLPATINKQDACAVILAGTTACHLIRRAQIADNTTVLVTGTTGGVGTLVIQMLKYKKCRVIASTSHKNKKEELQKQGIGNVVSVENMVNEVKAIAPDGVDCAIDLVGGDTWSKALQTLRKNGTLVFCSTSKEEMGKVDIGNAFAKQLNILGSYGGNRKHLQEALRFLEKGILKPVIDSVVSLEDVRKAHEKIEKQEVFGKILLEV